MRNAIGTVEDRTPTLAGVVHPEDVVEVYAEPGFQLFVRFYDGTAGRVAMSGLIQSPRAGVFAKLADPAKFAEVCEEHGAVTWPEGLDLAPDAMYEAIRTKGTWVLSE